MPHQIVVQRFSIGHRVDNGGEWKTTMADMLVIYAYHSYQFYDWNGQRLDVSSGARFRPPVIMSSGPSLLIRFYANGGTGLGYKAFYSFVIGHSLDKSVKPITDCGGYVENLGGAITMMDMVGEGVKTYDCVWLIRPPKNFLHLKTHMYLKVITFADMGERAIPFSFFSLPS